MTKISQITSNNKRKINILNTLNEFKKINKLKKIKNKVNIQIKIKNIIFLFSLLYITIYLSSVFVIYSSSWYEFNYKQQETYLKLSEEKVQNSTSNLINYLLHKEELNDNWNSKEKLHYIDVRSIYDNFFILFILSLFGIIWSFKKINLKYIKKASKTNIVVILFLCLIFPIFQYFWDYIFHPLIFNNNLWLMFPTDISYYLFPYSFFKNSLLFIVLVAILQNLIIYIIYKFYQKDNYHSSKKLK